jgi:hypothetical protein
MFDGYFRLKERKIPLLYLSNSVNGFGQIVSYAYKQQSNITIPATLSRKKIIIPPGYSLPLSWIAFIRKK